MEAELELLDTFADICEISRNRPTLDEEDTDESVHSPREHFHSFLHSLDAEVEGLPPSFQTKIVRALRNYDVDTLEPGPELEEAVYRLFLALQRMENQVPVIPPRLSMRAGCAGSHPPGGQARPRESPCTPIAYAIVFDPTVALGLPISTADAVPRAPTWLATSRFRLNRTRFRGRNELHPETLTVVRAASLSTAAEVRLPWTWIALLRERGDYVSALRQANSTDYGPW